MSAQSSLCDDYLPFDMDFSTNSIKRAGGMPRARETLMKTVTVGVRFPRSSRLMYSRVRRTLEANSSWVMPAFNLVCRKSSLNTGERLAVDMQPVCEL